MYSPLIKPRAVRLLNYSSEVWCSNSTRICIEFTYRATLGLLFVTVLIQKSDKQWKVFSGCLQNLPTKIPSGHQTFPLGCAPRERDRKRVWAELFQLPDFPKVCLFERQYFKKCGPSSVYGTTKKKKMVWNKQAYRVSIRAVQNWKNKNVVAETSGFSETLIR